MQPPRTLWVPFPLGRPLGKPGDAAFQRDVIEAALKLLDSNEGPVIEDYPHDAPRVDAEFAAVCPVSFAQDDADDRSWVARLNEEFRQLKPWYDLSCRRRGGRTLVGIADQSPEQNTQTLARHLDEAELPADITWMKRAVEDIKAYYIEAMTAQPGDYDAQLLQTQLWQQTSFGAAVLALYEKFARSDNDQMKMIARILAPRDAVTAAADLQGGHTQ